jgi:hypothetical protein
MATDYLDTSARWLVDATYIYDLAEGAFRALRYDFVVLSNGTAKEGPFLSSLNGLPAMQSAAPFCVKTRLEAGKAAELALGVNETQRSNQNSIF